MPENNLTPFDIVQLADTVNSLNMLLAWDLATIKAHAANQKITVECKLLISDPRLNGFQPTLYLTSGDMEELVTSQISVALNKLQAAGIDMAKTLEAYRSTAEQLLGQQHTQTPIDKGDES
jgi:hypothetical protein